MVQPPHLVLVGFMVTGKSAVGAATAALPPRRFWTWTPELSAARQIHRPIFAEDAIRRSASRYRSWRKSGAQARRGDFLRGGVVLREANLAALGATDCWCA
jgi:hypothetical protein